MALQPRLPDLPKHQLPCHHSSVVHLHDLGGSDCVSACHADIFVTIELFSLSVTVRLRRYKQKSVEVGVFRRGWVTLSADFGGKGASPTNHYWCQSSRVIALSYGIKISAVYHLDLSQSTRVTDRQTNRRTNRQNYDFQDRPRICSRGKTRKHIVSCSGTASVMRQYNTIL